jgi:farnesyl-diphosphate farnesyltransferase
MSNAASIVAPDFRRETSTYLLRDLLKQVSRSFYLTLRILPRSIRPQISLAYLLARATDTVADTEIVSVDERLSVLRNLCERILANAVGPLDLAPFLGPTNSANPSERILLQNLNQLLQLLASFESADQQRIKDVLSVIISGQELDLIRFGAASAKNIIALRTAEELDDYTYRVAGCVGEFWTRTCLAHLHLDLALDRDSHLTPPEQLLRDGIAFGKGLQLVNVLRDVPRDLRQGRCYLPADELAKVGLKPDDLLDASNEERIRPIYNRWLDRARSHLAAGWEYTNTLPRTQFRLRLACAWPILIGMDTLDALATNPILDSPHPVKISRRKVRQIILRSVLLYPCSARWRRQFHPLRKS